VFSRRGRPARECDHAKSVIVRNAGIERAVCEACGRVSFRALEGLSGTAVRSQFEREIERARA
jgi:hypothetical protein